MLIEISVFVYLMIAIGGLAILFIDFGTGTNRELFKTCKKCKKAMKQKKGSYKVRTEKIKRFDGSEATKVEKVEFFFEDCKVKVIDDFGYDVTSSLRLKVHIIRGHSARGSEFLQVNHILSVMPVVDLYYRRFFKKKALEYARTLEKVNDL